MQWSRLKIDPYLRRSFLGIHVDYDLEVLVIPIHSQWAPTGFPRQVIRYDGGGVGGAGEDCWEIAYETILAWPNAYSSNSSTYHRGIIDMITYDGDYYMNRWEYSEDKGFTWTRYTDIGSWNPHGISHGGDLYYGIAITGTNTQFYISRDFGVTWTLMYNEPIDIHMIYNITIPSGNASGNVIVASGQWKWVGPDYPAIVVSYNGGLTWDLSWDVTLEIEFGGVKYTAISETGNTMFAATTSELWRSNGDVDFVCELYASLWHADAEIRGIRYLDHDDIVLVPMGVSSDVEWVAISRDDGVSWADLPLPTPSLYPTDGSSRIGAGALGFQFAYFNEALYLAQPVTGLLWKTEDWGETWDAVWAPYDINDDDSNDVWLNRSGAAHTPKALAMDGNTIVFTSTVVDSGYGTYDREMIVYSTDLGETFKSFPHSFNNPRVRLGNNGQSILVISQSKNSFVCEENGVAGILITHNAGADWTFYDLTDLLSSGYSQIRDVAVDFTLQKILFIEYSTTYGTRLFYSSNGGEDFDVLLNVGTGFYDCAISGNGSALFYHDTTANRIYKSTNEGGSWVDLSGYCGDSETNLQASHDGSILAVQTRTSLYVYEDGAKRTLSHGTYPPSSTTIDYIMNYNGTEFIVVADPGDISYSTDGGYSFTKIDPIEINSTRLSYFNYAYAFTGIAGAPSFTRRIVASDRAGYFYFGSGSLVPGLIKAISTALFRETNKRIIGVDRDFLKKISGQPDDEQYLP